MGPGRPRRLAAESTWAQPLAWDRKAARDGVRRRVFCASLADVFDPEAPPGARERLWALIEATPHLDWLLLTKRIENARTMMPTEWVQDGCPNNVWMGVSVTGDPSVSAAEALDLAILLRIKARIHFLSYEPALGPVALKRLQIAPNWDELDALRGEIIARRSGCIVDETNCLDWVICGGESGPGARPAHPDWFRKVRDDCAAAGVAYFFKQWGEWSPCELDGDLCVETLHVRQATKFNGTWLHRLGKRAAGNLLDGRTHVEFPG